MKRRVTDDRIPPDWLALPEVRIGEMSIVVNRAKGHQIPLQEPHVICDKLKDGGLDRR